jgi:RNA 2',3'-cyclic 3'-phosphodiesterase
MFVALDLPERPRDELAAWRDRLMAGRAELRPVAPEALHVTLSFLAWQREADAGRIAELAFGAAAGHAPPRLRAVDVRAVPPRGPRLFALDLDDEDGRATALQGAIAEALEQGRVAQREARPFWPHVTLARVKRGARAAGIEAGVPPLGPFEARTLTLYRSTLRPQGALYEPLARTELPPA